jgi:hypothetical protein
MYNSSDAFLAYGAKTVKKSVHCITPQKPGFFQTLLKRETTIDYLGMGYFGQSSDVQCSSSSQKTGKLFLVDVDLTTVHEADQCTHV